MATPDNISKLYNAFSAVYDDFANEVEFRDYVNKADAGKMQKLYDAFAAEYDDFGSADELKRYVGWQAPQAGGRAAEPRGAVAGGTKDEVRGTTGRSPEASGTVSSVKQGVDGKNEVNGMNGMNGMDKAPVQTQAQTPVLPDWQKTMEGFMPQNRKQVPDWQKTMDSMHWRAKGGVLPSEDPAREDLRQGTGWQPTAEERKKMDDDIAALQVRAEGEGLLGQARVNDFTKLQSTKQQYFTNPGKSQMRLNERTGRMEEMYPAADGRYYPTKVEASIASNTYMNTANRTARSVAAGNTDLLDQMIVDAFKAAETASVKQYEGEAQQAVAGGHNLLMYGGPEAFANNMRMQQGQALSRHNERMSIENITESVWNAIPEEVLQAYVGKSCRDLLMMKPDASEEELNECAKKACDALAGHIANKIWESASDQARKDMGSAGFVKQTLMSTVPGMLFMGAYGNNLHKQAFMQASQEWGQEHWVQNLGAMILGMSIDPTTRLIGSGANAMGRWSMGALGRLELGRGVSSEVAGRYMMMNPWGRGINRTLTTGYNFAGYETAMEAAGQVATGEYDLGKILIKPVSGFVKGAAVGASGTLIGNATDKAVRNAGTTGQAIKRRVAGTGVEWVAEMNVFATADMLLEGKGVCESWQDAARMVLGFKGAGAVKAVGKIMFMDAEGGHQVPQPPKGGAGEGKARKLMKNIVDRLTATDDFKFTDSEYEELERYGYDDVARMMESLSKDYKKTDGGVEILDRGLDLISEMIEDNRVSETARAKMVYVMTGMKMPMSTVMAYKSGDLIGEGGKMIYYVEAIGSNGVISHREYDSKEGADRALAEVERQAELNTISIGEDWHDAAVDGAQAAAAAEIVLKSYNSMIGSGADATGERSPEAAPQPPSGGAVGSGATKAEGDGFIIGLKTAEDVYNKYMQLKQVEAKDANQLSDAERRFIADYEGVYDSIEGYYAWQRPEGIRADIKQRTGVDVEEVLGKDKGERTAEEETALKEYATRLYHNQLGPDGQIGTGIDPTEGAFEAGYNATEEERVGARDRLENALDDVYDRFGEHPYQMRGSRTPRQLIEEMRHNGRSEEDLAALEEFFVADETYTGMMRRIENDTRAIEEAEMKKLDAKTHADGQTVRKAVTAYGKEVYVVEGEVRMDGVDVVSDEETVVVYDETTGKKEMMPPSRLVSVEIIPVGGMRQEIMDRVDAMADEAYAKMKEEAAQEAPQSPEGGEVSAGMEEETGNMDNEEGGKVMGGVRYSEPGEIRFVDETGKEVVGYLTGYRDPETDLVEYYKAGERQMRYASDDELTAMVVEYRPMAQTAEGRDASETDEAETQATGMADSQGAEQATGREGEQTRGREDEMPTEGAPQPPEGGADADAAEGAGEGADSEQRTANGEQEEGRGGDQGALGKVPRDERGEPVFEQSPDVETGWDALVEYAEGDAETAQEIAESMAEGAKKTLDKAMKAKMTGKTPAEMLASKKVNQAKVDAAQAAYDMWKGIAGEQGRRAAEAKAEAERAERSKPLSDEYMESYKEKIENMTPWDMDKEIARVREAMEIEGLTDGERANLERQMDVLEREKRFKDRYQELWLSSPLDVYEHILEYFTGRKHARLKYDSVQKHTGFGTEEMKRVFNILGKGKDAMTIERLAEVIWMNAHNSAGTGLEGSGGRQIENDMDVRDAIIELLMEATPGGLRHKAVNYRKWMIEKARADFYAEEQADYEREIYEKYGMNVDEYEAYEEVRAAEHAESMKDFDQAEYDSMVADEYYKRKELEENGLRRDETIEPAGEGSEDGGSGELLPGEGFDEGLGAGAGDAGKPGGETADGVEGASEEGDVRVSAQVGGTGADARGSVAQGEGPDADAAGSGGVANDEQAEGREGEKTTEGAMEDGTGNKEEGAVSGNVSAGNSARYEELRARMKAKLAAPQPPSGGAVGPAMEKGNKDSGGEVREGGAGYGGRAKLDAEMLQIGIEMTEMLVEDGKRSFGDYCEAMIADLGDEIRPYLKQLYGSVLMSDYAQERGWTGEMSTADEVRAYDVASHGREKQADLVERAVAAVEEAAVEDEAAEIRLDAEEKAERMGELQERLLELSEKEEAEDLTPEEVVQNIGEIESMYDEIAGMYGEEPEDGDAAEMLWALGEAARRWRKKDVYLSGNDELRKTNNEGGDEGSQAPDAPGAVAQGGQEMSEKTKGGAGEEPTEEGSPALTAPWPPSGGTTATAVPEGAPQPPKGGAAGSGIQDWGEKIHGARKDALRELASKMSNVTVADLVAQPLGKVFKAPDWQKSVAKGEITAEDARVLEAISRLILRDKKPTELTRNRYANERRKREIVSWAEHTAKLIDGLRRFAEAETEEERQQVLSGIGAADLAAAKAERQRVLELNPGRQDGGKYAPNELQVALDIIDGLGYPTNAIGKTKMATITTDHFGNSYEVRLDGRYQGRYATYEEAIAKAVRLAKVTRGDTDVEYTPDDFGVRVSSGQMVKKGTYEVVALSGRFTVKTVAQGLSKEEADRQAEAYMKGHKGAVAQAHEESVMVNKYKPMVKDPVSGERYEIGEVPEFDSTGEADAWVEAHIDDLQGKANEAVSAQYRPKGKGEATHAAVEVGYDVVSKSYMVWAPLNSRQKSAMGNMEVFAQGFGTRKEAMQWLSANQLWIDALYAARKEAARRYVYFNGAKPRVGADRRGGRDVSEGEFGETFGFRGVQFGNWANQRDRQNAVNEAYDALHDLAGVLGVSPKAIGLAGDLGIAFGARGNGGASAHYEPSEVVINLTKTKGAGSLAHEWWHALDNYFARHGGIGLGMMTEEAEVNNGVRKEIIDAYRNIVRAIQGSAYDLRSKDRGAYWGSPAEETARLFAEWVNLRLGDSGSHNSFLSRGIEADRVEGWKKMMYEQYKMGVDMANRATAERNAHLPESERKALIEPMKYEDFKETERALAGFPYPTEDEVREIFDRPMQGLFDVMEESAMPGGGVELKEPVAGYGVEERRRDYGGYPSLFGGGETGDGAAVHVSPAPMEEEQPHARGERSGGSEDKYEVQGTRYEGLGALSGKEKADVMAELSDRHREAMLTLEESERSEEALQATLRELDDVWQQLETLGGADVEEPKAMVERDIRRVRMELLAKAKEENPGMEVYVTGDGEEIVYTSAGEKYEDLLAAPLRPLDAEKGEYCFTEVQFEKAGYVGFTTGNGGRIESADDVAYMFRKLESARAESVYAVMVKDGKGVVVHLGTGGRASSAVDFDAVRAGADRLEPDAVYILHNHPSGTMSPSVEDGGMLNRVKALLPGVKVHGLIIDTWKKEYVEFGEGQSTVHKRVDVGGEQVPVSVWRMSEQTYDMDYEPKEILSTSQAVAELVANQRLAAHGKVGYIIVNNAGLPVANIVTDERGLPMGTKEVEAFGEGVISNVTRFGGSAVMLYGSDASMMEYRPLRVLRDKLREVGMRLNDSLYIKGRADAPSGRTARSGGSWDNVDGGLRYSSATDNGVMEPGEKYGDKDGGDEVRFRTSEELDADYPTWLSGQTTDSGQHTTQITSTKATYKKIGANGESKRGRAEEMAGALNTAVKIVESADEADLSRYPVETAAKMRRAKGWYDAETGEVVVNLSQHSDAEDVAATVLHETVAHKGLDELLGGRGRSRDFYDTVYEHLGAEEKARVHARMGANGWDAATATAEYMGELAEKGFEDFDAADRSIWKTFKAKVLEWIDRLLGEAGLRLPKWVRLGDNELRYMLWRSRENLRKGREMTNAGPGADARGHSGMEITEQAKGRAGEKPTEEGAEKADQAKREELGLGVMLREGDTDDIWRDGSMGMEERVTLAAARLSAMNAADAGLRDNALRAITDNLQSLVHEMRNKSGQARSFKGADAKVERGVTQAALAQGVYDRTTVKRVTDLAKALMQTGWLSDMTGREIQKLLGAVGRAPEARGTVSSGMTGTGAGTAEAVEKILDLMIDNQVRGGRDRLDKLLSIRGSKVDARGVQVQGELDADGVKMVQAMKRGMKMSAEDIRDKKAALQERMGDENQMIADEAALEYYGMDLAEQYVENITASKTAEGELRAQLREAEEDKRAGRMEADAYRELAATTAEAIRKNKIERAEAYNALIGELGGGIKDSIERAEAWRAGEKLRVQEIQHNANSDMEGRPSEMHRGRPSGGEKAVNFLADTVLAPLQSFEQLIRSITGAKAADGESYLYNRFVRGLNNARAKEITGYRGKMKALDAKVRELFGRSPEAAPQPPSGGAVGSGKKVRGRAKSVGDLIALERRLPKMKVRYYDASAKDYREAELTQGNLGYIYMVDKMTDGRMKLRKMGITEDDVAAIADFLDPRVRAFCDWVQEEFLPECRKEYNETHKRMFGAPMAAIEDYFPLKILGDARGVKEDIDASDTIDGMTSTVTGAIKKRTVNSLALDIMGADAFNVLLDHLSEMEHWNAYAELGRDMNTLLSYGKFRNRVKNMHTVYGNGEDLWKRFKTTARIAFGTYHPETKSFNDAVLKIARGVTAAKVSFRFNTALKQLLSMPAVIPELSIGGLVEGMKNPEEAFMWAMKNLPVLQERWRSRISGDPRLMKTHMGWNDWRNNVVEKAGRLGMTPNAFIDIVTCSIVAKAVYDGRLHRYLRDGYSRAGAEKKAREDASIVPNLSQQSSEGAYLSPLQANKDWLSTLFTIFRNASMSYTRQVVDSVRGLKRNLTPWGQKARIDYMTKQVLREWAEVGSQYDDNTEGYSENKARRVARRRWRRSVMRDALRFVTFGWVLPGLWSLGGYQLYLLFGSDEDEKGQMLDDAKARLLSAPLEGLTGGDVMSNAVAATINDTWNEGTLTKDMPMTQDIERMMKTIFKDQRTVEGLNDLLNLAVQMGFGFNPSTIENAVLGILDACGSDVELANEAAILAGRILNCPESQVKKLYFDEIGMSGEEASKLTPVQIAERYAGMQVKLGRPLTPWLWDDGEALAKPTKTANTRIKERLARQGDKGVNEDYARYKEQYDGISKRINDAKNTDYIEAARVYAEIEEDSGQMLTYGIMKGGDRMLNRLTSMYLKSGSAAEATRLKATIVTAKAYIVAAIESGDEAEAGRLLDELSEIIDAALPEEVEIRESALGNDE